MAAMQKHTRLTGPLTIHGLSPISRPLSPITEARSGLVGSVKESRGLTGGAGMSSYRCHSGAKKLVASSNVALRRKSAGS